MGLALAALLGLAHACAPTVAPATLLSVARAESNFDPLAIGINGRRHQTLHPATLVEALSQAQSLAARGANFDVGLAQINTSTLSRLGLSLFDALDPCRNLATEAHVLSDDYQLAHRSIPDPQAAIRGALSRYNTGDGQRGLRNGYVARVYAAAEAVVPALELVGPAPGEPDSGAAPVKLQAALATGAEARPRALDVFARAPSASIVWRSAAPAPQGPADPQTTLPPQPGDPS